MKKSVLFVLVLLLSSLAFPAFSQKGKPLMKWQDSLQQIWVLDSVFDFEMNKWKKVEEGDEGTWVRFCKGTRAIMWSTNGYENPRMVHYEALEGEKSRYVTIDYSLLQIEHLGPNMLRLSSMEKYSDMLLSFSRQAGESFKIESWVTGYYNLEEQEGWTVYPPLSEIPVEIKVPQLFLVLDSSGKMKHQFGEADSGTWRLDDKLILELNGAKKQLRFHVVGMNETLMLNPVGSDPDSILTLRKDWRYYFSQNTRRVDDSIRAADSMAAMAAYLEAEMAEENQRNNDLVETWHAVNLGDASLVFSRDSTVVYSTGKKKHKGTWGSAVTYTYEAQMIPLVFDGREQIAVCTLLPGENEMEARRLTITFVPPGKKKLETLTFCVMRLDYAMPR